MLIYLSPILVQIVICLLEKWKIQRYKPLGERCTKFRFKQTDVGYNAHLTHTCHKLYFNFTHLNEFNCTYSYTCVFAVFCK